MQTLYFWWTSRIKPYLRIVNIIVFGLKLLSKFNYHKLSAVNILFWWFTHDRENDFENNGKKTTNEKTFLNWIISWRGRDESKAKLWNENKLVEGKGERNETKSILGAKLVIR